MSHSAKHNLHITVQVFHDKISPSRTPMHPDKKSFIILFFLLAIISGGLLAWRLGFDPTVGTFFASNNATQELKFQTTSATRVNEVGRAGTYDYSPSIIKDASGMKVYVCGGGTPGDSFSGHDAIYLTQFSPDGTKMIDSRRVISPTINTTSDDSMHACAPSVIQHSFSLLENGANKYLAYYECAPKVHRTSDQAHIDMFTQICVAYSDDGITWEKYSSKAWEHFEYFVPDTESATPIITINSAMAGLYEIYTANGKYWTNAPLKNGVPFKEGATFYGVGHPSALVRDGKIWLYYYDSVGVWGERGLFLRTSDDGYQFSDAVKIDGIKSPVEIKYIQSPIGGRPGYFIALGHAFNVPYYNYSWDGIHWQWAEVDSETFYTSTLAQYYGLDSPAPGMCMAPGGLSLVSDSFGVVQGPTVTVATNEGKLGNQDGCSPSNGCRCYDAREDAVRGSTWQASFYTGEFATIGAPATSLAGDLNSDGIVNAADLSRLVSIFGQTSDLGGADLIPGNGVDIFDYNELVRILNQ